jgi:hypothetical protein
VVNESLEETGGPAQILNSGEARKSPMQMTDAEYREKMLAVLNDMSLSLAEMSAHEKTVAEYTFKIWKTLTEK